MMNEDNYNNERAQWKFVYKAEELLPLARKRLEEHRAVENKLRDQLSALIKDPASFHDDNRLQQIKRDVDRHSGLREQFEVYTHEFSRTPKKEFALKLSDVVFFGLHTGGFTSSEG
jgi:hypothetical protein